MTRDNRTNRPSRSSRARCRAVCQPGLESLLRAELTDLGLRPGRTTTGGVSFDASTRDLYATNLWLRSATRVVVRAGQFEARTFADLEAGLRTIPWHTWLAPDAPVRFRVSSHGSSLYHTGAIEQRVAGIVGRPVATTTTDPDVGQLVLVRVAHDEVTVSIDSSGEPLYKRGWRQQLARAPLRETLAAAMLLGSGWSGATPLVDPMCGSGTIPIEAALLARGIPPGVGRSFAFADWPTFEPGTWASVAGAARAAIAAADTTTERPPIVGRDRDTGAIEAARANAERAGVAADIDFDQASISELVPPLTPSQSNAPGWLLVNPPYGARVTGGQDLRDLYARFGVVLRSRFPSWSVGVLAADPTTGGHLRLPLEPRWRSTNGGIEVSFLTGTIPSETRRP